MLYRLFTEDKNEEALERVIARFFDGFTLLHGMGFWKGSKEASLIVEVVLDKPDDERVNKLADAIKFTNKQEAVLIEKVHNANWIR